VSGRWVFVPAEEAPRLWCHLRDDMQRLVRNGKHISPGMIQLEAQLRYGVRNGPEHTRLLTAVRMRRYRARKAAERSQAA
jgi:hypothetical protein